MKDWPQNSFEKSDVIDTEEVKIGFTATVSVAPEIMLPAVTRFSKYYRFSRTTAWMLRAVKIRFNKSNIEQTELLPQEITKAEILIFKKVQFEWTLWNV